MKFLALSFLLFISFPVFCADQVILKEGKSLYGKILSEDQEEVVLDMGQNMILRVNRKKISKISREEAVSHVPQKIITYQPQVVPSKTTNVITKTPEVSEIEKKTPAIAVGSPNQVTKQIIKGVLTVNQTISKTETGISAENFLEARQKIESQLKIFESDAVVGTKNGQPILSFSWTGNYKNQDAHLQWSSVVLNSSMTIRTFYWSDLKQLNTDELSSWMKYRENLNSYQAGFDPILQKEIESFAVSLTNLIGIDEQQLMAVSNELFLKFKKNVDFRFRGYFRREQDKRLRQKK